MNAQEGSLAEPEREAGADRLAMAEFHRNEDRWLSVDEIAAYLGIKRETVYPWITKKNMPAHKVAAAHVPRRRVTLLCITAMLETWFIADPSAVTAVVTSLKGNHPVHASFGR